MRYVLQKKKICRATLKRTDYEWHHISEYEREVEAIEAAQYHGWWMPNIALEQQPYLRVVKVVSE